MKQLTRIQELDEVLKVIVYRYQTDPLLFMNYQQIKDALKQKGHKIHVDYLAAILEKLLTDGYISDDKKLMNGKIMNSWSVDDKGKLTGEPTTIKLDELGVDFYFPTWDGLYFMEVLGGYEKDKIRKDEASDADAALKLRIEKREDELKVIQGEARDWTRKATKVAKLILWIELFLLLVGLLSIMFDHPDSFEWFWRK